MSLSVNSKEDFVATSPPFACAFKFGRVILVLMAHLHRWSGSRCRQRGRGGDARRERHGVSRAGSAHCGAACGLRGHPWPPAGPCPAPCHRPAPVWSGVWAVGLLGWAVECGMSAGAKQGRVRQPQLAHCGHVCSMLRCACRRRRAAACEDVLSLGRGLRSVSSCSLGHLSSPLAYALLCFHRISK